VSEEKRKKERVVSLRLDDDLYEKMLKQCLREKRTVSDFIRVTLEEYLYDGWSL